MADGSTELRTSSNSEPRSVSALQESARTEKATMRHESDSSRESLKGHAAPLNAL